MRAYRWGGRQVSNCCTLRSRHRRILAPCRTSAPGSHVWPVAVQAQQELQKFLLVEDFESAAQRKDHITTLTNELSPLRQTELFHLLRLHSSDVSDKLNSLHVLAEIGTEQLVVEAIVDCLQSEHLLPAAEDALLKIWARHPSMVEINDLMEEGCSLMGQASNYGRALSIFDEIIKLDPEFAEGWNKKATVLFLEGRYPEAIVVCEKVLALQSLHYRALTGKGMCHAKIEEYTEAIQCYDEALLLNPHLSQIRRYRSVLNLARIRRDERNHE